MIHCRQDPTIPSTHSAELFEALLDPLLPPLPFTSEELIRPKVPHQEHFKLMNEALAKRNQTRMKLVRDGIIEGFASRVSEFDRIEADRSGKVKFVETLYGGHTSLVGVDGVIDTIGEFFDIWR